MGKRETRQPKYHMVTIGVTCRAGESLESACWRWRPVVGDELTVQQTGDGSGDGRIVLRLYVRSWQFDTDDPEFAGKDAVEKYRLSVGEGDVVEVVETVQVWSADR